MNTYKRDYIAPPSRTTLPAAQRWTQKSGVGTSLSSKRPEHLAQRKMSNLSKKPSSPRQLMLPKEERETYFRTILRQELIAEGYHDAWVDAAISRVKNNTDVQTHDQAKKHIKTLLDSWNAKANPQEIPEQEKEAQDPKEDTAKMDPLLGIEVQEEEQESILVAEETMECSPEKAAEALQNFQENPDEYEYTYDGTYLTLFNKHHSLEAVFSPQELLEDPNPTVTMEWVEFEHEGKRVSGLRSETRTVLFTHEEEETTLSFEMTDGPTFSFTFDGNWGVADSSL